MEKAGFVLKDKNQDMVNEFMFSLRIKELLIFSKAEHNNEQVKGSWVLLCLFFTPHVRANVNQVWELNEDNLIVGNHEYFENLFIYKKKLW